MNLPCLDRSCNTVWAIFGAVENSDITSLIFSGNVTSIYLLTCIAIVFQLLFHVLTLADDAKPSIKHQVMGENGEHNFYLLKFPSVWILTIFYIFVWFKG